MSHLILTITDHIASKTTYSTTINSFTLIDPCNYQKLLFFTVCHTTSMPEDYNDNGLTTMKRP